MADQSSIASLTTQDAVDYTFALFGERSELGGSLPETLARAQEAWADLAHAATSILERIDERGWAGSADDGDAALGLLAARALVARTEVLWLAEQLIALDTNRRHKPAVEIIHRHEAAKVIPMRRRIQRDENGNMTQLIDEPITEE